MRIELTWSAWEAAALPLCYTRRMPALYTNFFIGQDDFLEFAI